METIKQRLNAGKIVRVLVLGPLATTPKWVEVAGVLGGYHGIWIDQEHAAVSHHSLEAMLIACRAAGLDAFARVAPTDYGTVMRPLEAGCSGVMVAQIRTLAQVHQAVQWSRYPPRGIRGLYTSNYEAGYGTLEINARLEKVQHENWLAVQIETAEAVDGVEEIAGADGVDCLFVGPADLACTLGVPGQPMHPRCVDALQRVSAASKRAGIAWGALVVDNDHATKCRELGCQLFSISGDLDSVRRGIRAAQLQYQDLFSVD